MKSEGTHLMVGGGVIGLCSAYYLAKAGHRVVVVDRDASRRENCSDRNAGMVVPSHFIPLASPGVVTQGLKWMLNRRSPFFLRPRMDRELWAWCWQFIRHSNASHVAGSCDLLRDLSLESRSLMIELASELGFPIEQRGLLMLCQSVQGLHHEVEVAKMANEIGVEAEVCGPERLAELDPDIQMNALGGVWFPQDCHLDPEVFLAALRERIVRMGGEFYDGEVSGFCLEDELVKRVEMEDGRELEVMRVVLSGGAWTSQTAEKLGLRLPMQGGKGYSFTLPRPRVLPQLCSLLKEGRVAVTPMGETLRVAGTMEICGNDLSIDRVRLEGIVESFCRFFPEFLKEDFEGLEPWSGLRPCSPDGLPYVGGVPGVANVTVATGHSMLGLSLGPVTGRLVSRMVAGYDVDARLAPQRFH